MLRHALTPIPEPITRLGFFLALFASLFLFGYGLLSLWQTKASQKWPIAEGTVLTSDIIRERVKAEYRYKAEVTYRYRLNGRDYQGNRLHFGWQLSNSQEAAQAIVSRYTAGASILVYYNPAEPWQSVLEPASTTGATFPLIVGGWRLFSSRSSSFLLGG